MACFHSYRKLMTPQRPFYLVPLGLSAYELDRDRYIRASRQAGKKEKNPKDFFEGITRDQTPQYPQGLDLLS